MYRNPSFSHGSVQSDDNVPTARTGERTALPDLARQRLGTTGELQDGRRGLERREKRANGSDTFEDGFDSIYGGVTLSVLTRVTPLYPPHIWNHHNHLEAPQLAHLRRPTTFHLPTRLRDEHTSQDVAFCCWGWATHFSLLRCSSAWHVAYMLQDAPALVVIFTFLLLLIEKKTFAYSWYEYLGARRKNEHGSFPLCDRAWRLVPVCGLGLA